LCIARQKCALLQLPMPDFGVGREVARIDGAEGRVDRQAARVGLAAARGVAARAVAGQREVAAALDLLGRGIEDFGLFGQRVFAAQVHRHEHARANAQRAREPEGPAEVSQFHRRLTSACRRRPHAAIQAAARQRSRGLGDRRHRLHGQPAGDGVDVGRGHAAADLGHAVGRHRMPLAREPGAELRRHIEPRQAEQPRDRRLHAGERRAVALHAGRNAARRIAFERELAAALQLVGRRVAVGEIGG
jgi:hypothetical protein